MNTLNDADRLAVMAYVDGELPEDELLAFEARLARDEALFEAVARERALRGQLGAHFGAVLDEPLPARLLDALGAAPGERRDPAAAPAAATDAGPPARGRLELVPPAAAAARAARRAPAVAGWQAWGGMAACLVLGLAAGSRLRAPAAPAAVASSAPGPGAQVLVADAHGTLTAAGALRAALERQAGGASVLGDDGVAIGLTFRDKARDYCRTFAVDTSSGIACKTGDQWTVATLERAPDAASGPSTSEPYRMASSGLSPTLLHAIDALRDGDTLDAASEAAARARDWRP